MRNFEDVLKRFEALSKPQNLVLPGKDAHFTMAPTKRIHDMELFMQNPVSPDTRLGAVLILLFPSAQNKPGLCLMRRPLYAGVHSGQIGFPGGKMEEIDAGDLMRTALREAHEEVNIEPRLVKNSIAISKLYIPPSRFLVHPFLAYSEETPQFIPDPAEVEEILLLPLHELFEKHRVKYTDMPIANGKIKNYPYYDFSVGMVWGATAMIMAEVAKLLNPDEFSL